MDYEYTTPSLEQHTEILETLENENNFHSYVLNFIEKYLFVLIITFFSVLIVANNTCLIIAICKFDRLRTTTNYIILNFALVNLAFSIISTLEYLRAAFKYQIETLYYTMIIIILVHLLQQICYTLAALLIIDWFVMATFKNFYSKYTKFYKWILASCNLMSLLCFIIFFKAGFHYYSVLQSLNVILYWLTVILMIIINIVKYYKQYSQKSLKYVYGLSMGNLYLIMWGPFMVIITLSFFLYSFSTVLFITMFLYLVGFVAPIAMTFLLIKLDKNFKMSYYSMFKSSPPINLQEENNREENV